MADDTVEIKITANAADLQAALQQAAQAVQGASAAMAKSAADAGHQTAGATDKLARQQVKAWESAFKPMESGFDTMLKGMLMKHQTFSQALTKGATTFLNAEISADVQRLGHWLASKAAELAVYETTKTAEVATTQTANATTTASDASTAKTSIMQHAASAAAAVYDDVAQIPYVGWILAPAAAVAAFAGVMAFGSSVPGLAVGAWNLPNDMVAQLHAGETVMPADFASVRDIETKSVGSSRMVVHVLPSAEEVWRRLSGKSPYWCTIPHLMIPAETGIAEIRSIAPAAIERECATVGLLLYGFGDKQDLHRTGYLTDEQLCSAARSAKAARVYLLSSVADLSANRVLNCQSQ